MLFIVVRRELYIPDIEYVIFSRNLKLLAGLINVLLPITFTLFRFSTLSFTPFLFKGDVSKDKIVLILWIVFVQTPALEIIVFATAKQISEHSKNI